jgi:DNA-binding CsgD family transcriptional regulator
VVDGARPVAAPVVGREAEITVLERALEDARSAAVALVVEGEAGIGKTTLWREAVRLASDRSFLVLTSRPGESEAKLSFSGLADLLADVGDDLVGCLPPPQRSALDVALLRAAPAGRGPDRRTVAAALLGILREAAARRPVLIGVDDVQWLDGSTTRVLEYAVRRLAAEPIAIAVTVRTGTLSDSPLGIGQALVDERMRRLSPGPLDPGDLSRVIASHLGVALPPPAVRQIGAAAGGNPFFALEIARALRRRPSPLEAGERPPVPEMLGDLVRDRLRALPPAAREVVLLASALTTPTVTIVRRAAMPDRALRGLDDAADSHVVDIDGDRIRFTHPLLASVAYASAPRARRRDLHRALAEAVEDPEERARHLALASEVADETVAAALEAAAESASLRGATDAATELMELAVERTPGDRVDARWRRLTGAAFLAFTAGDLPRSGRLAHEVVRGAPRGPLRARALWRLGWIRAFTDNYVAGTELFLRALSEVDDDLELRIKVEYDLSWSCRHAVERAEHAASCLAAAQRLGDPALLAAAMAMVVNTEFDVGRGLRWALAEQAFALEQPDTPLHLRPGGFLGPTFRRAGELDRARSIFDAYLRIAEERGEEQDLAYSLYMLAEIEFWAGHWDRAERMALDALEAAERTGQIYARAGALYCLGLVEAGRGSLEAARASAEDALGLAIADRTHQLRKLEFGALPGSIELSAGDAARAHAAFAPLIHEALASGIAEPSVLRFVADDVEALVALGDLESAKATLGPFEDAARRLDRPLARATAGRCRGLIAAALGDPPGAMADLDEAIMQHARVPIPFELGRTLLAAGRIQRRARKWRAARGSLLQALEIFERLGSPLWSTRATAELARLGGRSPSRWELTTTERRVAGLVAEGKTNREVADALFVSVSTVHSTLRSIYRKVGVRSRTELAARMSSVAQEVRPASR